MQINIQNRTFDISKSIKSVSADIGDLTKQIYTSFLTAWDEDFRMSLRPKRIQKVINTYTAIAIMPAHQGVSRQLMLDEFEKKYVEFYDSVTLDSERGSSFAVAWCVDDQEDGPEVQALVMFHPFQNKAFDNHAFGGTAWDLGLIIDCIPDDPDDKLMGQWVNTAMSILHHSPDGCAKDNMRFIKTKNTVFPEMDVTIRPIVPRTT